MRKIQNHNIAQLLMQLKFTPQEKRQALLDSTEKLISIIENDMVYPFEFVCFKITGFHPKGLPEEPLISGSGLIADLRVFLSKLSGQIAHSVSEENEPIYTINDLAKEFEVSAKTVHRWRLRGLKARYFVFKDGKKKLGFTQSKIDEFIRGNPQIVSKARQFHRMVNEEKQNIIQEARRLAQNHMISRRQVYEEIAKKTGRSTETIRIILLKYETANPENRIFEKSAGVITSAQATEIYKLSLQGCGITELMERFARSRSSIYRIINQKRAKAILSGKVEFIDSDEFLQDDAEQKILGNPISFEVPTSEIITEPSKLSGNSLTEYISTLKEMPLLNREQEMELFRRYNYLKYKACLLRTGLKATEAASERITRIESYLSEAEKIKKMIIEANLRLVASIANKHITTGTNPGDLISEGNISLMHAVEKFDYTRGFRFATFASWVITKDYARQIPAETDRPDKAASESMENIQHDLRTTSQVKVVAVEQARQSLVEVIRDNLNQREQYIIINHFGLIGTAIKREKKSLDIIGKDLGLTRERVRQLELQALQKLKHSLSIEEFELLTE
ncbi:MAG: sigma-70 family RNA polymerase sigma factor [Candidatus Brocadiia bacterium]|nr:MAG: sigma-70 family RNA polymerase sigma factor [Candidatus Brocadiia bacterium]